MKRIPALLWIALLTVWTACEELPPKDSRPHVFLITVDTLRADHLKAWGYERETAPTVTRLAGESVVFRHAMAQAPHTLPSLLQLMTGLYIQGTRIENEHDTLAEVFQRNGYWTLGIADNPLVEMRQSNLHHGFDDFYLNDILDPAPEGQLWKTKMPADVLTRQALRSLKKRPAEKPVFAWIHYFDPHDPYLPPFSRDLPFAWEIRDSAWTGDIRSTFLFHRQRERKELTARDRQHLIDLYDAEIAYLDRSLDDLLQGLESMGLLENSILVFTADHGEGFGEHGHWTHGKSVYQEEVHVPLFMRLSADAGKGRVVDSPAGLVDVFETLTHAAGLPDVPPTRGQDLLLQPPEATFLLWYDWVVVQEKDWKLIRYLPSQETQLYHLAKDPAEQDNLANSQPEALARLEQRLKGWLNSQEGDLQKASEQSRETVEQLRAMGYFE